MELRKHKPERDVINLEVRQREASEGPGNNCKLWVEI